MPSPKSETKSDIASDISQVIEETALAAEVSAEHAEKALEQAEADDLAARKAAAKERDARLCPNCHGELIDHGTANPHKAGARHCNGCGACWAPGLKEQRAGHPAPVKAT